MPVAQNRERKRSGETLDAEGDFHPLERWCQTTIKI